VRGRALAGGGASARLLPIPETVVSPVVFELDPPWLQAAKAEKAQVSARRKRMDGALDVWLSLIMTTKFLATRFVPKMCLRRNRSNMNAG
jgi:hypothetical protein